MQRKMRISIIVISLCVAVASSGCGKSGSSIAGSSAGGAATVSGVQLDAQNAVMAEINRHFVKSADGYITARTSGSPYAPDHYIRQIHEITPSGVQAYDLSDSDKMNGIEWAGEVDFKATPVREAGDSGIALEGIANTDVDRPRGRWSQWVDFQPDPVHVQKEKGQWMVTSDTWLLRGTMPTAQDFTKAGIAQ
jgi:hypothetical protein